MTCPAAWGQEEGQGRETKVYEEGYKEVEKTASDESVYSEEDADVGHVPDLVLRLGRPDVGRLALLLADVHPVAGVVLLHLHALHLLLDGFHGWRVEDGGWRWRMEDGAVLSPAVSRS